VKSGNIAKEEHNTGLMRFKILNLLGQLTLQVQHIIITLNIGTNLFHLSLNVSPILFLLLIRAHRMLIHFEQLSSSALSLSQFKECFFFHNWCSAGRRPIAQYDASFSYFWNFRPDPQKYWLPGKQNKTGVSIFQEAWLAEFLAFHSKSGSLPHIFRANIN
jgi:hypothetical protein